MEVISPLKVNMINMFGSIGIPIDIQYIAKNIKVGRKIKYVKTSEVERGICTEKKSPTSFNNSISIFMKPKSNSKIFKLKLYSTGIVHVPGCKKEYDCIKNIRILANYIKRCLPDDYPDLAKIKPSVDVTKSMYVVQYKINSKNLNKDKISKIFCNKYKLYSTPSTNSYTAAKIKVPIDNLVTKNKTVTVIIQTSGIIKIAGANSKAIYEYVYKFINKIFKKHYNEFVIKHLGTPELTSALKSIKQKQ